MSLQQKLQSLNITLPAPPTPAGAYIPARKVGNLIFISGQLPMKDGKLIAIGQVPSRCSIEQAKLGARQCAINALAAASGLSGGIDQLAGVVRVGVFVNSEPTFIQLPQVANGASELLLEIFDDPGKHVRAAVGSNALPLDAAVEIEFIFEC